MLITSNHTILEFPLLFSTLTVASTHRPTVRKGACPTRETVASEEKSPRAAEDSLHIAGGERCASSLPEVSAAGPASDIKIPATKTSWSFKHPLREALITRRRSLSRSQADSKAA
jgi:hypothetical protein